MRSGASTLGNLWQGWGGLSLGVQVSHCRMRLRWMALQRSAMQQNLEEKSRNGVSVSAKRYMCTDYTALQGDKRHKRRGVEERWKTLLTGDG